MAAEPMFLAVALLASLLNPPGFSPEIVSAPIVQPLPADVPGQPFTITKTNHGFVAAWSGVGAGSASRIFVARLDETAHAVGSAHAFGENPAYSPTLGVDGDRVVLGWLERGIDGKYREVVTALDPDLARGTPVLSGLVTSTLIVGARDGHTFVVTDDSSYDFIGGRLVSAIHVAQQPDSAVFVPGSMLYSAHAMILQTMICGFGDCYLSAPNHYVLFLGHDSNGPMTQTFNQDPSAHRTAIAFGSNTGLLAWYNGSFNGGGSVVAVRFALPQVTIDDPARPLVLGRFGPSTRAAQPSIAWDSERYLVVWQDASPNMNIHAAAVALDGTVTPLAFPSSAASETNPVAVAIAPGRFLIGYEIEGTDTRIGVRFVNFNAKPRAGGR